MRTSCLLRIVTKRNPLGEPGPGVLGAPPTSGGSSLTPDHHRSCWAAFVKFSPHLLFSLVCGLALLGRPAPAADAATAVLPYVAAPAFAGLSFTQPLAIVTPGAPTDAITGIGMSIGSGGDSSASNAAASSRARFPAS